MTTFVKLCALCDSTATLYFQCQSLLLLDRQHAQVVKPALGDTLCSVTATATATYSCFSDMLFDALCFLVSGQRRDCIVARSRLL